MDELRVPDRFGRRCSTCRYASSKLTHVICALDDKLERPMHVCGAYERFVVPIQSGMSIIVRPLFESAHAKAEALVKKLGPHAY
jgi:hypothetical protein